ncbi:MAG: DMT family transporter, partial [Bacteroidia bacterium]
MSKGVKSIFIAVLLFSGMNIFVKLLSHLPVAELTFFRSIFTFFVCYFLIKRKGIPLLGSRRPVLFLRGLFGSISLILFFQSVHSLPLATATLVHYITPFFTTFFGFLFLKERFYKIQWLFLIICFTGIAITQSSNTHLFEFNLSNIGLLSGLGGCIAAAGAYNCIRKIGVSEDPNVILIYFSFITIPVSLALLYFFGGFQWPTLLEWLYILCMGLLTQAAQYFMTLAYQNEKVGTIAIFTNMGIIYAIINGMLFFNEIPTPLAWLGISIVILGLLLNIFFSHKSSNTLD